MSGTPASFAESAAEKLARFTDRWHIAIIAGAAILTAVSALLITRLDIKSDFVELLPQDYQSVKDIRKLVGKVGGIGNLSLAFESSDVKASERIADDLAAILKHDYRGRIRYIEYKIDAVRKYYTDNAHLFMDREDLEEIFDRLERRIRAEKMRRNPLFVDLTGDTAKDAVLDFTDIEKKYRGKGSATDKYIDGYFTGEDGRLLVMMIKPFGTAADMPATEKLIGDITADVERLGPAKYAPDLKYGFAGVYKIGREEYDTIKKDILSTALLCVSLVAAAIFLFFRRTRAVILLGVSCVAAVAWAFGITYLTIGYVNTVTAFIGAIIVGTGINYGIILMARYFEERRLGHGYREALLTSMAKTVAATFGAAAATTVSFGIFLVSDVKSFSQFGFIGGIGILFIWVATYTLLPALIVLSERIRPSIGAKGSDLLSDKLNLRFMSWVLKYPRAILAVFSAGAVASAVLFAHYLPGSIEYDSSKLRTKSSMESGTAKLDERIAGVFDVSMTPATILVRDAGQSREVCTAIEKRKKEQGNATVVDRCKSVYEFLPDHQDEKLGLIRGIKKLLDDPAVGFLAPEQIKQVDDLKRTMRGRALTLVDIPEELSRVFTDKEGNVGTFAYVYPVNGKDLWIEENLRAFTDTIRKITLDSGEVITSSGEAVIFADLLRLLKRDGPVTSIASFLGVYLVLLLIFRSVRSSIWVAGSLVFGSLLMVGLMALMKIKLNFFNFVALPMTFGIGVDYAINIYQRYLFEGRGSMEKVLRRTGSAVILCSLTTIIGYFTLIIADSNALVSLGALAILGEFTCLASAIICLPAMITLAGKRGGED